MKEVFKSDFKITQAFGVNKEYYQQFGLAGHEGIDLIPTNLSDWTIISPENDGQVVKDIDYPMQGGAYGITMTIWYPKLKIALQFCHLSNNFVKIGDDVQKGQEIGVMGDTGNTNGAHLHLNRFEVDENGIRLNKNNGYLGGTDPLPYLQAEDEQTIPVPKNDFVRIVSKSSNYDKVVEYLSLGNPDETPYDKVQSAIGGYKSRATDLDNQLTKALADAKNREEQVARLKEECQQSEVLRLEINSKLADAMKKINEMSLVYEDQLKSKQIVIDGLAKEKGTLNTEIATQKQEIAKLKNTAAHGLSVYDILLLLLQKAIPFLKKIKL